MKFNKKLIVLIVIGIFVIGLQMATVSADGGYSIDKGSFEVKNKKIDYIAWKRVKNNPKQLIINFLGDDAPKKYEVVIVDKVSKNKIKTSIMQGKKEKHLKTFNSKKDVVSFYKTQYKQYIIKEVKKSIK